MLCIQEGIAKGNRETEGLLQLKLSETLDRSFERSSGMWIRSILLRSSSESFQPKKILYLGKLGTSKGNESEFQKGKQVLSLL